MKKAYLRREQDRGGEDSMMSRRWLGVLTPQGKPSLADFSFQVFNVFPSPEQDDQNAHLSRGYSTARDQARPRRFDSTHQNK